MNKNELNIIFSSDDNYAPYLGAAVASIIRNNQNSDRITIYIIENEVSNENKQKLELIISESRNTDIVWIPFKLYRKKLNLNLLWNISISSYARLFIAEMVPQNVERIIYMDCDMIVCQSLYALWNTDLEGKTVGVVQDTVGIKAKNALGLNVTEKYFNAGMLLIDLAAWREKNIGERCLEFLDKHKGCVYHHDQGILNGVLVNEKYILPMKYNTITIHYMFNMRQIRKYYNEQADFYSLEEINDAKKNPAIIHFTPSFTTRPWVRGCKHPLRLLFWEALKDTPWYSLKPSKNNLKWYARLLEWRYRVLPY